MHKIVTTDEEAILKFVKAGGTQQGFDYPNDFYQNTIVNYVKSGQLTDQEIDVHVADVLYVKDQLGLFQNPYTDPKIVSTDSHFYTY
jgi:beta-glucosidase